jgi:hypothetical protein
MSSRTFTKSIRGRLYFYNGTAFPIAIQSNLEEQKKQVEEMIMLGLKTGVSLKEQIKDYKEQLDKIEACLYKHCNPSSAKGLKKVEQELGRNEDSILAIWQINILALLRLKAIKDDDNNGTINIE